MFVHFNDAARLVMRLAEQEARRLRHDHIATEDLLLALLQLHDSVAARVLGKAQITLEKVRLEVQARALPCVEVGEDERRLLSQGAQKAIELAGAAMARLGHGHVVTGHLLLGLLEEAEGTAFQVLCKLGIVRVGNNLSRVAERVIAEMEAGRS